jgi:hypothetical protein
MFDGALVTLGLELENSDIVHKGFSGGHGRRTYEIADRQLNR